MFVLDRFCRGVVASLMVVGAAPVAAAAGKGLTVDDMLEMERISEHVVSPDGKTIAFSVRSTDLKANRGRFDVWTVNVDGSQLRQLTTHADNDNAPQFSADGAFVYFLSSRNGASQVWKIARTGGEAQQVTDLALDVNGFKVFPDGRLLLAMDVYPEAKTLADTKNRAEAEEKAPAKVKVYDELLFRHWDQWEDGRYSHLFVFDPQKGGEPIDLVRGQRTDSPTHPFGGMEEVAISPDGKQVAFVARVGKLGTRDLAYTTNTDVFVVNSDGKSKPVDVTAENLAYEFSPVFSPDGASLAFLAMTRPGYEADKQHIAVLDLKSKKRRALTEKYDRSFASLAFSNDGNTLWTSADHIGHHAIFAVDVKSGDVRVATAQGTNREPLAAKDRIVFAKDTLASPVELMSMKADGSDIQPVTHLNDARVKAVQWGKTEQFSFEGNKGEKVHGFIIQPAGFKGQGKVPVAFLIHGGPQGSFGDHFHYRWNPQVFAGHGYATVFIDFHGSTGYGQAFTDAINGDWGGAPYEDLMKGLDFALQKYSYLDANKVVAMGASYGGFMINWINGHTDRFKALVCHDGNIDERMAYFDTEELWFPEWEHGGTPWDPKSDYNKHNPVDFVKNWKTPTLVIHGGRDYRVVDTQGMGTFTALQRRGIPSRFVYFPEENHWVLKPHNSKRWHEEVFMFIDTYTRGRR